MSSEDPLPTWWALSNIAVIAFSAVGMLFPESKRSIFYMLPYMVVLVLYFFGMLRRLREEGTGHIPLSQLYEQVKGGRKLRRKHALENAALAVFLLDAFFD